MDSQGGEHQGALNHAAQRGIQLKGHGQLNAADIQAREKESDQRRQPDTIIGKHCNQQGQISIVAGYGGQQTVIDAGNLQASGNARKTPGKNHGQHHIASRFEPKQVGSKRIASNGFQIQADPGVTQNQGG